MIYTVKTKTMLKSGAMIPAIAALLVGLILLFNVPILGFLLLLVTFFFVTAYDGIELDTALRKYRIIMSIYGIKRGRWTELPPITKVIYLESSEHIYGGDGIANSFSGYKKTHLIRLVLEPPHKSITVGKFPGLEDAKANAAQIASELNVPYELFVKTRRR